MHHRLAGHGGAFLSLTGNLFTYEHILMIKPFLSVYLGGSPNLPGHPAP